MNTEALNHHDIEERARQRFARDQRDAGETLQEPGEVTYDETLRAVLLWNVRGLIAAYEVRARGQGFALARVTDPATFAYLRNFDSATTAKIRADVASA